MREAPLITVITPSYNQARFIERTIKSVLSQAYPRLEYIIIDGGSTDGTIEILKRYSNSLRWVSEKDSGQTSAINKGIRMSSGEIIGYLNSDDLYEQGALEKVADFFLENPSCKWATGLCGIVDAADAEVRTVVKQYKNLLLRHFNSYATLLATNYISQPATFLKREVFTEFGFFDENEDRVMDYEFWLRIGRTHAPCVINDYLARFRVHAQSKTSGGFRKTFRDEMRVARRYSGSGVINVLHYMSYLCICAVYSALSASCGKRQG